MKLSCIKEVSLFVGIIGVFLLLTIPTVPPVVVSAGTSGDGNPTRGNMEFDIDRPGQDFQNFDLQSADPSLCQDACSQNPQCKAWTYVKPNTTQGPNPRCWLKSDVPPTTPNSCCVSGVKR